MKNKMICICKPFTYCCLLSVLSGNLILSQTFLHHFFSSFHANTHCFLISVIRGNTVFILVLHCNLLTIHFQLQIKILLPLRFLLFDTMSTQSLSTLTLGITNLSNMLSSKCLYILFFSSVHPISHTYGHTRTLPELVLFYLWTQIPEYQSLLIIPSFQFSHSVSPTAPLL